MNPLYPIYTEKTECQDCYKCVRACPVKAIQIKDGHAAVVEKMCIMCGNCVTVCPMKAKRVRSDVVRAKQIVKRKERVFVSLAPSYVSEFHGIATGKLITAIKKLGFSGVSETAVGAEEVSAHVAEMIDARNNTIIISSACPSVVEFIRKYRPNFTRRITPLLSPVLAHGKILKELYGESTGVVLISPCIAKKKEAEEFPHYLDLALTFEELKTWLNDEKIVIDECEADSDGFILGKTKEGALYPVDGGMIAGIKANIKKKDPQPFYMAVSGIENLEKTLEGIEALEKEKTVFLEFLACEGGCVNGPMTRERTKTGLKRFQVIEESGYIDAEKERKTRFPIEREITTDEQARATYSTEEITEFLRSLGKFTDKDELNCSGCGYDSCRDLAKAYLDGRAERTMCVSYMRKLAQKKANALLQTMPSGVVIVNEKLHVIECNRNFAKLMGSDILELYDATCGLEGADVKKIVPFVNLIEHVFNGGCERLEQEVKKEGTILHVSIFAIEAKTLVGCIIQDITAPAVQKEQVIAKSQAVIQRNLETVQKIAYLLGENAAESEVLLNAIIKSFVPGKIKKGETDEE
jgi:iron only hydrogenase large subunit-like protein